jgi:hypothetical protein
MTEQQEQINSLVARLEKHQAALRLNDSQWVARYGRYVGSQKTWRNRLCQRDWTELGGRMEKWVAKLTQLVTVIDGGSVTEEFYDKLPISEYGRRRYEILQGQTNDRRCVVLLGLYGVGKTVTLRRLNEENPTTSVYVRAMASWRESLMQISLGMARALGCKEGLSAAATFNNVVEHLKANPVTVMIDEVHEAGVLIFKLIKTLIDETRAKFMIASYPTAWTRLCNGSNDAYAEAQQLIGRTMKPIDMTWCKGVVVRDIEVYIEAATELNGESRPLAERVLPAVRRGGNLRLLADAIEMAKIAADSGGGELGAREIEACVNELCPVAGREGK